MEPWWLFQSSRSFLPLETTIIQQQISRKNPIQPEKLCWLKSTRENHNRGPTCQLKMTLQINHFVPWQKHYVWSAVTTECNNSVAEGWGMFFNKTWKKYLKLLHQNRFYHPTSATALFWVARFMQLTELASPCSPGEPLTQCTVPTALPREQPTVIRPRKKNKKSPLPLSQN